MILKEGGRRLWAAVILTHLLRQATQCSSGSRQDFRVFGGLHAAAKVLTTSATITPQPRKVERHYVNSPSIIAPV